MRAYVVLAVVFGAACGSSEDMENLGGADAGHHGQPDGGSAGAADAAPDAPTGAQIDAGPFVPASHPPFAQLVKSSGDVLANPKVVGVFFSDYTHTDDVVKMIAGLPTVKTARGDSFWTSSVAEYGVGLLTVLPPIKLTETAPTTSLYDPAIWLAAKLATDPAFAGIDANTIVAIFYPASTPLVGSCAAPGGDGYGGFHDSVQANAGSIPYAVVAECASFGPITNALDMITVAGSHEIIEASTDPQPTTAPAYATIDQNGWPMHVLLSGNEENGDMCTINNGFVRPPAPYGYLIQRGWSNAAAAAGNQDPCAPDLRPSQPFVGAFPVTTDTVSVFGVVGSGPGVKIATGASKTVEVDCFSFEPTAPFTVVAREPGAPNPPNLTFAWDQTTCVNGDKLHLTITMVNAGFGARPFALRAHLPNTTDTQAPTWAVIVTN